MSAFEKWFETQWPQYAATIKMYEEKSPAVDYMDAMLPLRIKHAAQEAWDAALEHAARIADAADKSTHPADLADAIRKDVEK